MFLPRRRWRKLNLRTTLLVTLLVTTFVDFVRYHRWSLGSAVEQQGAQNLGEPQKIFIASTHWNNEAVLRAHWNSAVVELVRHFGVDNVHVSVYESGSWDDSKGALRELDRQLAELGASRTIVLDETTHQDVISQTPGLSGWIDTPRNARELRRIPYLSQLRNLSLEPLQRLFESGGVTFDKILFLNDVVFTVDDVLALLGTNGGDYAAACSLDFSRAPSYYDTFALHDAEGHETVMQTWPYFRSSRSRSALKANRPVPVASCWNGMVFMPAAPFYNGTQTRTTVTGGGDHSPPSPLRFRGLADSLAQHHLEASECCLIHSDNPLSLSRGVWVNPTVRVGYNKAAYDAMNSRGGNGMSMSLGQYLRASWENRLRRWLTTDLLKTSVVRSRLRKWEREGVDRWEAGAHCIINEMQVLISNGWKHL